MAKHEAKGTPPKNQTAGKDKAEKKGAPRPRKWNYGIIPEATIARQGEDAKVKREVQKDWLLTEGNPTVEVYKENGGTRHGLRVMSRRGLIKIIHADGSEFPQKLSEKPDLQAV